MSGQPTINPTDASKFREQYLSNLALRARIDDQDLQANKIYKKTGQTPTQPTDNRTTEEKYADIERLKIDLRSALSSITDGTQAEDIVNKLTPDQLLFASTFIDALTKELKPKYKYGVPSSIFIPFLERYMEREIRTRGVDDGLQQATGRQILLGVNQIIGNMIDQNDLLEVLRRMDAVSGASTAGVNAIRRDVEELRRVIPDRATLEQITTIGNATLRARIQEDLNEALQNLPTRAQIYNALRMIETAQVARDNQALIVATQSLHQLLSQPPSTMERIQELERNIIEAIGKAGEGNFPGQRDGVKYIPTTDLGGLSQAELRAYVEGLYRVAPDIMRGSGETKSAFSRSPIGNQISFLASVDNDLRPIFALPVFSTPVKAGEDLNAKASIDGVGIKGKGLSRHIDNSKGIKAGARYVPFGKFVIHNHRLMDDMITLRRPTGSNITHLPSTRVSRRVGHIVRKIVGGGHPTFDELNDLNADEKDYLHKLVKSSNIADRISVPSPNRDEEDKDINQFEIMKGEIMSGNDNVDLIKKFKVLLVKLTNKGLIPKGQSKDILMDLVSMGF